MKIQVGKLLISRLIQSHSANSRSMYDNLKNNDYARPRTTILGVRALRHLLCFSICMTITLLLLHSMFDSIQKGAVVMIILKLVGAIYTGMYSLLFLPLAINLTVKQLKLNKRAIGKICLALLILIVLAFIVLALLLFV